MALDHSLLQFTIMFWTIEQKVRKGEIMFGWFTSLLKKSPKVESNYDEDSVYKPKERRIYQYWDGSTMVLADPLVLYRRVMDKGLEISIDLKVSRSASKDAGTAYANMIKKMRDIFQVKDVVEGGLTEAEVMGLFNHFLEYCENVKKNSGLFQTSAPPSPTTSPSLEANQNTTNTLASGSIEGSPITASPTQPPLP